MGKKLAKNKIRLRKHERVRKKIKGTSQKPRLNIFRSLNNIYAQIVDDTTGKTLAAVSTLDSSIKSKVKYGGNKEAAKEIGKAIAQKASEKGIKQVVFDRGGYIYHGRVKELAESARESGLEF